MKLGSHYLIFLCVSLPFILVEGQQSYRHIRTIENLEKLEYEHPNVFFDRIKIEQFIQAHLQNQEFPEEVFTVAVIIHSLYNSKENRVTEEQVLSQLQALNRDFNSSPLSTSSASTISKDISELAGVPNIQFCLADYEVQRNQPKGILYKQTERLEWSMDDKMKSKATGGSDPVHVHKYLNIWVVNLEEGNSGYAQMPGGLDETDGIVIDYEFFGTGKYALPPYHLGKTLTHLTGNYFNLYPLWSRGLCQDDFVPDTPIHNGPNYGCPSIGEVSTCYQILKKELTVNFMDNTDDGCMLMFTKGQVKRMQALLQPGGARSELREGVSNCLPPGSYAMDQFQIQASKRHSEIIIAPNPANNQLQIEFANSPIRPTRLEIIDLYGHQFSMHYDIDKTATSQMLHIRNWPSGLYLFTFYRDVDYIFSKQVIVIH